MSCPDNIRESIDAFVMDGRPVGGFVESVLANNLALAVTRADERNIRALREIVLYVLYKVPTPAWGSIERVRAWSEKKRREREAKAVTQ